jgi:V/A-type H+-transporting ATPase subunit A
MLKVVLHLYNRAKACSELGIPISRIKDSELFERVVKMKYTIPNDYKEPIDALIRDIDGYYDALTSEYE